MVNQLDATGYKVIKAGYDVDEIQSVSEKIDLVLLYAEDYSVAAIKMLEERVLAEDIPVLLLGEMEEIRNVDIVTEREFVSKRIPQPISVKEVIKNIDGYFNATDDADTKKILVVDDSGPMLRLIKECLQDNYDVTIMNSGFSAIEYLQTNSPDLVLLDYEMPECDGSQVLEHIRTESTQPDLPVIFLTSKNDKESVVKVSALNPNGYLLKPMESEEILKRVNEYFESKIWRSI